jgi:hypothetical protein
MNMLMMMMMMMRRINNHSVTDGKVHIGQDKSQGTTKLPRIVLLTMVRNASMRRDADGTS